MSALNVLVLADRAFVGVDTTCAFFPTGQQFESCKILPMASAGVVLAGTGTADLLYLFAMNQTSFGRSMDFDAINEIWPSEIDGWFGYVDKQYHAIGGASPARSGQRLVAAGWSKLERRMAAILFHRPPGADKFEATRLEGALCTPDAMEDLTDLSAPDGLSYIRAIFDAQMRSFRAGKMGDLVIGGRMIVAELTRGNVTVTDRGPL